MLAALTYLLMPLDLIPDLIPVAGFSDDLVALTAVISIWSNHITPEIRERAVEVTRGNLASAVAIVGAEHAHRIARAMGAAGARRRTNGGRRPGGGRLYPTPSSPISFRFWHGSTFATDAGVGCQLEAYTFNRLFIVHS